MNTDTGRSKLCFFTRLLILFKILARFLQAFCHPISMRNPFRIALAMMILAILVLGCWCFWPTSEPVYNGKRLSYWLRGFDSVIRVWKSPGANPSAMEAENAVKAAGTNAIPTLLRLLKAQDPPWKARLIDWSARRGYTNDLLRPSYVLNIEAASGFKILSSQGADAVPALLEIYRHTSNAPTRLWVIAALGWIGPDAKDAVPDLVGEIIHSTTSLFTVRIQAFHALQNIHANPEHVVPALIQCLNDRDDLTRMKAAETLGFYGADAVPAVPHLVNLIERSKNGPIKYPDIEFCARSSLERIARASGTSLSTNETSIKKSP